MIQKKSIASRLDLMNWVSQHQNQPFDPTMVVTLSTGRADDWEWKAVAASMEELRKDGYITKTKEAVEGSYWTITPKGDLYLKALLTAEQSKEYTLLGAGMNAREPTGSSAPSRGWEQLKPLGGGGQSQVFLVRSPARSAKLASCVEDILKSNPWAPYIGGNPDEAKERVSRLTSSIWNYARPEVPSDLGALKIFKIPEQAHEREEALGRLRNEVEVLSQGRPGLVRLLEANETQWEIITELMEFGTLEDNFSLFKGAAIEALRAFRSLVVTVAELHAGGYVHRDIKPANVFLTRDNTLVLGDFGIVFLPNQGERLTVTNERVGPRDYMPQWGDLGERLENVHANFDVYMLGKLLWCMVSGRLRLPREYHNRPAYDLQKLFPKDPHMYSINQIIRASVVEDPEQCLKSASELLELVDSHLTIIEKGGQFLDDEVIRPCHVCGIGQYRKMELGAGVVGRPVVALVMAGAPIEASLFACDNCGHIELFRSKQP